MKFTIQDARALVESGMEAVGHARDEAEIIADPLIDCELRGLQFGGLPCALSIIERLRNTTIAWCMCGRPLECKGRAAEFDGGATAVMCPAYLMRHD